MIASNPIIVKRALKIAQNCNTLSFLDTSWSGPDKKTLLFL